MFPKLFSFDILFKPNKYHAMKSLCCRIIQDWSTNMASPPLLPAIAIEPTIHRYKCNVCDTCRWANCQAGGDCGCHSAHVESLKWQCCKTQFRYNKFFLLQSKCVDVSFALSHGTLLSKLSIGRWFGTPWRSCGVTVMTMLQNVILVLQMIMSPLRECWCFFCY